MNHRTYLLWTLLIAAISVLAICVRLLLLGKHEQMPEQAQLDSAFPRMEQQAYHARKTIVLPSKHLPP